MTTRLSHVTPGFADVIVDKQVIGYVVRREGDHGPAWNAEYLGADKLSVNVVGAGPLRRDAVTALIEHHQKGDQ